MDRNFPQPSDSMCIINSVRGMHAQMYLGNSTIPLEQVAVCSVSTNEM